MMARTALAARRDQGAVLIEHLRAAVLGTDPGRERCHVLFLDCERRLLGESSLGLGANSFLLLRMRPVFAEALRIGAEAMILAHNHPSGLCRPSPNDVSATRRIAAVGRALDVELLDHLIFTVQDVYSMRAGGMM